MLRESRSSSGSSRTALLKALVQERTLDRRRVSTDHVDRVADDLHRVATPRDGELGRQDLERAERAIGEDLGALDGDERLDVVVEAADDMESTVDDERGVR